MLGCGSHGEPMGLVDYAPGCDGRAARKLMLMETVSHLSILRTHLGVMAAVSYLRYVICSRQIEMFHNAVHYRTFP